MFLNNFQDEQYKIRYFINHFIDENHYIYRFKKIVENNNSIFLIFKLNNYRKTSMNS